MNRRAWVVIFIIISITALAACQPPAADAPTQAISTLTPTATATANPGQQLSFPVVILTTPVPQYEGNRQIVIDTNQVQRKAPEIYGLNGWWTDEDAAMWTERYRELNPGFVRVPVMGEIVEPANDDSNPKHINKKGFRFDSPYLVAAEGGARHLTYGKWFAALRKLDVGVMVYIPYLPGWLSAGGDQDIVSTYPPKDLKEYRELVRAVLHYLIDTIGFAPEKIIFEPINEPDLSCSAGQNVSCFWSDASQEKVMAVIQAAHDEAKAINPKIRIAGLSLCCSYHFLDEFLHLTADKPLLDVLTYHVYTGSAEFDPLLKPGLNLNQTGLPLVINEYGNSSLWSNNQEGALWHSIALGSIWPSQVSPIEFVMAEMPGMHAGFNELGLFMDWTKNWQRKPSYWIYANFYQTFPKRDTLALTSPRQGWELAGRDPRDGSIALWLTNTDPQTLVGVRLEGWHSGARVTSRDNLAAPGAESTPTIFAAPTGDAPLEFTWMLPAYSSTTLMIEPVP